MKIKCPHCEKKCKAIKMIRSKGSLYCSMECALTVWKEEMKGENIYVSIGTLPSKEQGDDYTPDESVVAPPLEETEKTL